MQPESSLEPPLRSRRGLALVLTAFLLLCAFGVILQYSHKQATKQLQTNFLKPSIDMQHYHDAGTRVARGELPHRDFFFEYPPTAAYVVAPPAIGNPGIGFVDFGARYYWYTGLAIALTFAGAWLLLLRRTSVLAATTFVLVALAGVRISRELSFGRFDAVVAGLTLIGWILLVRGRSTRSPDALSSNEPSPAAEGFGGFLLGLATGVKLYPALFAFAYLCTKRTVRSSRAFVAGFALALLPTLLLAILGPANFAKFLTYHSGRQFEIGSLYAAVGSLGGGYRMAVEYGSAQLHFPGESLWLPLSSLLTLLAAGLPLVLAWRRKVQLEGAIYAGLFSVAGFILFNKVGSPQYAVWLLIPAAALAAFPSRRSVAVLLATLFFVLGAIAEMMHYEIFNNLPRTMTWVRVKVFTEVVAWSVCGWAFLRASATSNAEDLVSANAESS